MTEAQLETLRRAIRVWGVDSQEQMLIGEIGELLTLFGRRAQGRVIDSEMVDEIADVTIMITQMAQMYGPEQVEERIAFKLDRLNARLDRWENQ
jgi:NTP pyrophosphatase (non-canonical NTP hydrolase)